ncbi:MAG: YlbF family regulator [Bacillota bacterium]
MKQEVITLAYELVDEIKSSETYRSFKAADLAVKESKAILELSEAFKSAEEKYNDAKQYGKHHPDLKTRQKDFQAAKKALYEHPLVKTYKEKERALQTMLDEIGSTLAKSVSPRLRFTRGTGLPSIGGSTCNQGNA